MITVNNRVGLAVDYVINILILPSRIIPIRKLFNLNFTQFRSDFGCRTGNGQLSNYFPVSNRICVTNSSICLIIMKYQLKFQMIINAVYFLLINIYNR